MTDTKHQYKTGHQKTIFDYGDLGYTRIKKQFQIDVPDPGREIAEAFGVGDGRVNSVADILIPDNFTILYITGESGSGKTTILNEYIRMHGYSKYEMTDKERKTPLFLLLGEERQKETIRILTSVGLSDVMLWMNTYENLSDSQQARCEIAVNMMHCETIVVDEFLSTLDRETAYPVSYSIQKAIRNNKKRMIVATAHMDLTPYLKPDVIVNGCAFPSRWNIEITRNNQHENPITTELSFVYGTKEDYKNANLGELHYKGKYTGGVKEFLFSYHNERLVALLVSTYNMHTGGRRISRLVVHPSYRGCGVGKAIVNKYLSDYPNTDVLASMALYNPVFQKVGMERTADTEIKPPSGLENKLKPYGFSTNQWGDKLYLYDFCRNEHVRIVLSEYASKATAIICPGGKRIDIEMMSEKIKSDEVTAARVLFFFRPRKMARFINRISGGNLRNGVEKP